MYGRFSFSTTTRGWVPSTTSCGHASRLPGSATSDSVNKVHCWRKDPWEAVRSRVSALGEAPCRSAELLRPPGTPDRRPCGKGGSGRVGGPETRNPKPSLSTTILFIDHQDDNRQYWVQRLRTSSPDCLVLEASNGAAGLAICESRLRVDAP